MQYYLLIIESRLSWLHPITTGTNSIPSTLESYAVVHGAEWVFHHDRLLHSVLDVVCCSHGQSPLKLNCALSWLILTHSS